MTKLKFTEYGLTERETEVLILVLKQYTNICIAKELNIHPDTVKAHIKSISIKMGVNGRLGIFSKIFKHPLEKYISDIEQLIE